VDYRTKTIAILLDMDHTLKEESIEKREETKKLTVVYVVTV
jgi:hypothetical protein